MPTLLKFLHLVSAIFWVGGMGFVLFALRPVAHAQLQPPQRLQLMVAALGRFFVIVWVCIATLLGTGFAMLGAVGMKGAPLGWHVMMGLGLLMVLVFGHIYFAGFRRAKQAVAAADWPLAGKKMAQVAALVQLNFALAWLAIVAVFFLK